MMGGWGRGQGWRWERGRNRRRGGGRIKALHLRVDDYYDDDNDDANIRDDPSRCCSTENDDDVEEEIVFYTAEANAKANEEAGMTSNARGGGGDDPFSGGTTSSSDGHSHGRRFISDVNNFWGPPRPCGALVDVRGDRLSVRHGFDDDYHERDQDVEKVVAKGIFFLGLFDDDNFDDCGDNVGALPASSAFATYRRPPIDRLYDRGLLSGSTFSFPPPLTRLLSIPRIKDEKNDYDDVYDDDYDKHGGERRGGGAGVEMRNGEEQEEGWRTDQGPPSARRRLQRRLLRRRQ